MDDRVYENMDYNDIDISIWKIQKEKLPKRHLLKD